MSSQSPGVLISLTFLLAGCPQPAVETPIGEVPTCADDDCSGHGRCVVAGGAAQCVCDPGYGPLDLTCVTCAGQDDGDVHITRLSPTVLPLVNGAPAPTSSYETGSLWLRAAAGSDEALLSYSHQGEQPASLTPGRYQGFFEATTTGGQVPSNTVLALDVHEVWNEDPIILDVPMATLSGTFTVNGSPAPASPYDAGDIFLVDPSTGGEVHLGPTVAGSYAVSAAPGSYEIRYRVIQSSGIMPANTDALIGTVVVPAGDSDHDVDVPSVHLTGAYTLAAGPPPTSVYEQARIRLAGDGDDRVLLGTTTQQTFDVHVVPGTYDTRYDWIAGAVLPHNTDGSLGALAVPADTDVDISITGHQLDVSLTLDGGAFPASQQEQASLWIEDHATGGRTLVGTTHIDAQPKVLAGTYDLVYVFTSGQVLPRNTHAVLTTFEVTADKALTQDIATTRLTGAFTVNGGTPPASPAQDGRLWLEHDADTVELGRTWQQGFDVRAVRGTYDAWYGRQSGSQLPANQRTRVQTLTLDAPTVDNDLGVVAAGLSGDIFINEVSAAGTTYESGMLVLVDPQTGDEAYLGATSDGAYTVTVRPGIYDVHYRFTQGGADVPTNLDARVGCVNVERPLVGQ